MPVTDAQVIEALQPVQDPELHKSIVELDMVRAVTIVGGEVTVQVALTVAGCPLRTEITRRVTDAVSALDGVDAVHVDLTVMTEEQLSALRAKLGGGGHGHAQDGHAGHGHGPAKDLPFAEGSKTRVLGISSGKGGVGKSSVTVNLAIALAKRGLEVAVLDADVYGFSVPKMIGLDQRPVVLDDMIVPPVAHGVRCISMGFFAGEDQPVIWRGPMLHKALEQFLTDVYWGEPDFLLVDMPPGTGDVALSMAQFLPRAEVFVVTTPQPAAQRVAQRSALMAEKVHLSVAGVIENMAWFTGDDGKRYEIFGAGGGAELAQRLEVPLLGQVPLVPELREGADTGRPIVAVDPGSEAGVALGSIAERIDVELAPTRRFHPELKLI
jgi:ATP-binding protein involved in chromosome partitioning